METTTYYHFSITNGHLIGLLIIALYLLITIAFNYHVYQCLANIPPEDKVFPAWFAWLNLLPFLGYIFMWMTLPFGVGSALQKNADPNIKNKGSTLFGLGLALVILPLYWFIPLINIFIVITSIILFIIYWVKIRQVNQLLKRNNL